MKEKSSKTFRGISFPFTHHAYCLPGPLLETASKLAEFLEEAGIRTRGNPDYFFAVYQTLSIEESRKIRSLQEMKSLADQERIFVIAAEALTAEAQNSLLKTLEEPVGGARIFLIIESPKTLLPTVRSRLFMAEPNGGESRKNSDAADFLAVPVAARLKIVKALTDEIADGTKSKADAIHFVQALEMKFHEGLMKKKEYETALETILEALRELSGRSPSVKILLEHLSLQLPRLKS